MSTNSAKKKIINFSNLRFNSNKYDKKWCTNELNSILSRIKVKNRYQSYGIMKKNLS